MLNFVIFAVNIADKRLLPVAAVIALLILFFGFRIIKKVIDNNKTTNLKKNPVVLDIEDLGKEYKIAEIYEKYKSALLKPYLYVEHPQGEDDGAVIVNLWQISLDVRFESKIIKVIDDPKKKGSVFCIMTEGHLIYLKDAKK